MSDTPNPYRFTVGASWNAWRRDWRVEVLNNGNDIVMVGPRTFPTREEAEAEAVLIFEALKGATRE